MHTLETKDLVKQYRKRIVVDRVSIQVERGEIVGLLGRNGAGKTTTFRMVVGLIPADRGEIYFQGKEISKLAMYERALLGIGYLPQEPAVFNRLSVQENIEIVLEGNARNKLAKKERRAMVQGLLEEMNLGHLCQQKAKGLSGGERRRLEVARTLALKPDIIMLDEPFAAVDPILVGGLQKIIRDLKDRNIGVLITDHKAQETLAITDRAYIIHEGKILRHGFPNDLANDKEVRDVYLGENFFMAPEEIGNTAAKKSQKAMQKMQEKEYTDAVLLWTDVLSLQPRNDFAYLQRYLCFYEMGEFASAWADLVAVSHLNPSAKLEERKRQCQEKLEENFRKTAPNPLK